MATLNLQLSTLAFGDTPQAGSPLRRFIDWNRRILGLTVQNPRDEQYLVPPGSSYQVFNGTRPLAIDGTTSLNLTRNPIIPNAYRFTFVGGTNPGFRTDRGINLAGLTLTMTPNGGTTLTATASGATSPFSAVQTGDMVWIPGVSTGDAALFNPANEGSWVVLVAGPQSLVLGRGAAPFLGVSDSPSITLPGQFSVFSAQGIQVGDKVDITAGFVPTNQNTFTVSQVTSTWFEISTTASLAPQSGVVPTAAGLQIYTALKRWLYIEVDQEAVVRLNGDTGNTNRVSPVVAGDPEQVGVFNKVGPVYSVAIYNRSPVPMNVLLQSAE